MDILLQTIRLLAQVLTFAVFIRVILSWVAPRSNNSLSEVLFRITEPVLAPLRRFLPNAAGFDFSPLAAIILLQVISRLTYI